ncbi:MAG: GNAT family N-acetyltransferase [Clostridia bacterium]|nr:GNAT family N-acetyltransferase [Clostridia bacterium]
MENEYENPLLTSYYHIAVYETDLLIGYVDCVSNGVTDAYIQDLMIHPDYQRYGIGTDLMLKMIEYLKEKHIYMISVVFDESLKPFYNKFGFYTMFCGQMETYCSK